MMINRFYYLFVMILLGALVWSACEGPAGPDGQTGPQGAQGEQGPQGPRGEDGTANVFYSEWLNVNWNVDDQPMNKQMLISEPRITENFINRGATLAYLRNVAIDFNLVIALPFQDGNDFFYFLLINGHDTLNDGVVLGVRSVDNTTPVWDEYEGNVQVRYVLLPDGIPAKIPDGFFEDYEAVAKYFGIED